MARLTAARHRASARKAAARSSRARIVARDRAHDRGTDANPELIRAAVARLDPAYGIAIVEDDPYAPDARFEMDDDAPPADCPLRSSHREPRPCIAGNGHDGPCRFAPRRTAPRAVTMPVPPQRPNVRVNDRATLTCPRCHRSDFRANGVGLQWHLDNYPRCADMPRKAEHTYASIGG